MKNGRNFKVGSQKDLLKSIFAAIELYLHPHKSSPDKKLAHYYSILCGRKLNVEN